MKVAEREVSNSDEEFWVMREAGSRDEVKHVGRSDEWLSDEDGWPEWRIACVVTTKRLNRYEVIGPNPNADLIPATGRHTL